MSQTDDIEDSTAPLIEHLAELRTRLIRAVGAFIVGIVLAFTVAEPILQFLLGPIEATLRELGDPSRGWRLTFDEADETRIDNREVVAVDEHEGLLGDLGVGGAGVGSAREGLSPQR